MYRFNLSGLGQCLHQDWSTPDVAKLATGVVNLLEEHLRMWSSAGQPSDEIMDAKRQADLQEHIERFRGLCQGGDYDQFLDAIAQLYLWGEENEVDVWYGCGPGELKASPPQPSHLK